MAAAAAVSLRIGDAFAPPFFMPPERISLDQADARLDRGRATFVLVIPSGFQRRILAGRSATLQLNVDATRMNQAFTGSGYIRDIALGEVATFVQGVRTAPAAPVALALRARFNPALTLSWFGGLMEVINCITMLSVILAGAALIRGREHGTVEHLLAMPVAPLEIMLAKLWAMGAVVLLPLNMLSGANTPRERIPYVLRERMLLAPTTHFVELSQAILLRGAGIGAVWPQLLALLAIGGALFGLALVRFGMAMRRG